MACTIQKQSLDGLPRQSSIKTIVQPQKPRSSLPTIALPPEELQWPAEPVSMHTSQLRLTMMNEDPKDLHTARLIIGELRTKIRCQSEHIMKWRKAYALQVQQHFRYQKEKTEQMNTLTAQLLLLEARMKRKQKQIAGLLTHRELAIQRQQKVIDSLTSRLSEHGVQANGACFSVEAFDSLNDSDSAVVLEDIDSDTNVTLNVRRRSSGGGCGSVGFDGITVARSISDAIETSLNKYSTGRRSNCYLRRPEILETVYSVEEDPEPTSSDVAEKRDKFKNRSGKVLSSSSTEGYIDDQPTTSASSLIDAKIDEIMPRETAEEPVKDGHTVCSVIVPIIKCSSMEVDTESSPVVNAVNIENVENNSKSQVTRYNRVMSNHRSVTKPKDVKYKRINKAKSKSLEELRGRLKDLVGQNEAHTAGCGFKPGILAQTAQSFA